MLSVGGEFLKAGMTISFPGSQLLIIGEESASTPSGEVVNMPLIYYGPGVFFPETISVQASLATSGANSITGTTISYELRTLYTDRLLQKIDFGVISNDSFTMGYADLEDGLTIENGDGFMLTILSSAGQNRYFYGTIMGTEYI